MKTPWYKSKTKVGGVLIGGAMILSAVGGWLAGSMAGAAALTQIVSGVGVIAVAVGIRNALPSP